MRAQEGVWLPTAPAAAGRCRPTCQKREPRSGPPLAREASTASLTSWNQGSRTLPMLGSAAALPGVGRSGRGVESVGAVEHMHTA